MALQPSVYINGKLNLKLSSYIIKGRDATYRIHYWGAEQSYKSPPVHQHAFNEISYIVDGEAIYLESGKEYHLPKNTLFLTRPYTKHRILGKDNLFLIFVAFELVADESTEVAIEAFRQLDTTSKYIISDASEIATIRIWEALLQVAQHPQQLVHDSIAALSCALLTSFLNTFADDPLQEPRRRKINGVSNSAVYQAKLYIRDNLASPDLRLTDIARILHISERHLTRIFKDEVGQTCAEYIRKQRIRQASIMLTTSKKTIKQISEETGFDTVHYFTTVFSKMTGFTPRTFMEKYSK